MNNEDSGQNGKVKKKTLEATVTYSAHVYLSRLFGAKTSCKGLKSLLSILVVGV